MISTHERNEMFRRMVQTSTDPAWIRQQLARPHQYSRTFTVCMLFLGTAVAYVALFVCASI